MHYNRNTLDYRIPSAPRKSIGQFFLCFVKLPTDHQPEDYRSQPAGEMPWQTFGRYKKRHQAPASSGIGVGCAVTRLLPFLPAICLPTSPPPLGGAVRGNTMHFSCVYTTLWGQFDYC